ncbi:hypothetical protein OQY15_09295 [Pedobacter sp. MC2016-15]|uniref:hypothetical protein n=1 Tax=Pedobacter sp. MC2016-15 TaxID=2994473 RepID=UPI002246660D|nr:hypothetical protein [Pedobacter sp. MC2016-15]MCX2479283.1 hypothetical protein [Pedobacter sp. MC2016-15]
MKAGYYIVMFVLLQFFFGACKKSHDDIAFAAPRKQYDLTVEGGINTYFQTQYIRLSKPSLHPDSLPQPIRKAVVTVNDGRTDLVFREGTVPGVYTAVNRNNPNYNFAYKLTVQYNNQTYTAVDTLRQVVNIVDDYLPLSVSKTPEGMYNGIIPKHTFGYLNPNKWWISYGDIPIWAPSRFTQAQYFSYTHYLGSPNSLYPLTNLRRTFSLGAEDFVTISKISISEGYAKYLYAVFLETDWNGLFSSVPVNVTGNISGNAQGYFSVSDVDVRRYRARELR